MDENTPLELSNLEKDHLRLMKSIVQSLKDTPYVLKGGTALMLGYGLDRFSEDLDFDASKKINMENKIKSAAGLYFKNLKIEPTKNTETVQRYRVGYQCKSGTRKLKIETSFRENEINEEDYQVVDGMKIYKIHCLLDKKLKAAHDGENPRTAIRDIYDIWFIAKNFKEAFCGELLQRYNDFCKDINTLADRYEEAYLNDDLVNSKIELDELILGLEDEKFRLNNSDYISQEIKKAVDKITEETTI